MCSRKCCPKWSTCSTRWFQSEALNRNFSGEDNFILPHPCTLEELFKLLDYVDSRNVYDARKSAAEAALFLDSVEDFAVDVSADFIQLLGDSGSTTFDVIL